MQRQNNFPNENKTLQRVFSTKTTKGTQFISKSIGKFQYLIEVKASVTP